MFGIVFAVVAGGWIFLNSSGVISEDSATVRTGEPIFAGLTELNYSINGGESWAKIGLPNEAGDALEKSEFAIARDYLAYYSRDDNAMRIIESGGMPESVPLDAIYQGTQDISVDCLVAREGYVILNVGAKKNERKCFLVNINARAITPIESASEARMYADSKNSAIQLPTSEIVITVNSNSINIPRAQFGSWDYDPINNVVAWVDDSGTAKLKVNGNDISLELPRSRAIDVICLDGEKKEVRVSVRRKLPIAPYAVYSFDYNGKYLGVRVNSKSLEPGRTYEVGPEFAQFLQGLSNKK